MEKCDDVYDAKKIGEIKKEKPIWISLFEVASGFEPE